MTAKSRANLKAVFQTGDKPDGDDFSDLIDSFVSLTDTSAQSLAGKIVQTTDYINAFADVTAITSVEATATWTVVCAALTAPNASNFTVSGREVTFIGTSASVFRAEAQIEARGSAAQQLWLGLFKNSAAVSGSIAKFVRGSAGLAAYPTMTIVSLNPNDIVDLRVQVPDGPIASLSVFGVKYLLTPVG